ncbi:MAG: hypothetical protein PHR81_03280 [Bacteroidales bacterium]|nr:hypothetical protein [Bacteroidales bacterium]MDD4213813.1 hypothetical protein [Bacteroidales bacterium]
MEVQPNQVEYSETKRLLKFFSYFKSMESRGIPPTSILRKFVGGSSFNVLINHKPSTPEQIPVLKLQTTDATQIFVYEEIICLLL